MLIEKRNLKNKKREKSMQIGEAGGQVCMLYNESWFNLNVKLANAQYEL